MVKMVSFLVTFYPMKFPFCVQKGTSRLLSSSCSWILCSHPQVCRTPWKSALAEGWNLHGKSKVHVGFHIFCFAAALPDTESYWDASASLGQGAGGRSFSVPSCTLAEWPGGTRDLVFPYKETIYLSSYGQNTQYSLTVVIYVQHFPCWRWVTAG